MLLSIEVDNKDKLKTLYWECLCAPVDDDNWSHLALCQNLPFSLYIPSSIDRLFPSISKGDLRALVLVASPKEKYGNLAPFDVDRTLRGVRDALGKDIPYDVLANVAGAKGPPTVGSLCTQLSDQPYTLLHIVCHGQLLPDGNTALYFANDKNEAQPVLAKGLLEEFKNIGGKKGLPRLTFLSSCETADPRAEAGALGGLGADWARAWSAN